jgi:hypothetical protein
LLSVRDAIATENPASTNDFSKPAPAALPKPKITATGIRSNYGGKPQQDSYFNKKSRKQE